MENGFKICSKCKKMFPKTLEYFYKSGDRLRSKCKICYNEKQREKYKDNPSIKEKKLKHYYDSHYYPKNKEKIKEKYRKKLQTDGNYKILRKIHKKARQRKINDLKSNYTKEDWEICRIHFKYKCAYCGQAAELTMEHFIPVSKGGGYTKSNILPVCKSCNCSKRSKDFFDWYPKQNFYSKEREIALLCYLGIYQEKSIDL